MLNFPFHAIVNTIKQVCQRWPQIRSVGEFYVFLDLDPEPMACEISDFTTCAHTQSNQTSALRQVSEESACFLLSFFCDD